MAKRKQISILMAMLTASCAYAAVILAINPAQAETIPYGSDVEHPLLSQNPPTPTVVQVTGVKVNPTDKGVEVILETTQGDKLQISDRSQDRSFIADIPNAQLRLPNGDGFTFRSEKPQVGITEINVVNVDNNNIRVTVVGEASLPTVELFDGDEGLIFGVVAATQQAQQPPREGEESKPDESIELVVTGEQDGYRVPNATVGTRTDTPILDIPQSIQVIPQQVLKDQQIIRVDDALRNVSGVVGNFAPFGNSEALTLRGFVSDSYTNLAVVRDGFRTYDNSSVQETANLERIEVLKGPASVLYGQNDPGGLINLVTKQPLSSPFYSFQVQAGSFGLVRPSFDFSGPLSKDGSVLYRLNAAYQREDGFRSFETNTERYFAAPVLKWNLSDRTNLSFSLEYIKNQSPYDPGLIALGTGVINSPSDRVFNEPDDYIRTTSLNIGYNLEHKFSDNWTLRNAFRYADQDYQILATIPISFDESTGILNRIYAARQYLSQDYSLQTNVVGKFTTGFIKHTLLAGADLAWFTNEDVYSNPDFFNPTPLDVFNPVYKNLPRPDLTKNAPPGTFDVNINRVGGFVQDQLALGDDLILLLSLRFDGIDYRNTFESTSRYDSAWSPRVGFVYKPTDTVSVYASYARSFTLNFGQDINGDFLPPQTAEGLEVGVKAELFDKKLLATLAYFDITKQNVATADPVIPFVSVATGEQRSRGLELDISGQILPGWNVIGFYAYTEAEVTQDNDIPVGNRLPGAPQHSAGMWTTYEFPSGGLKGLGLGIGVNYVSNRFGDLQNSYEVGDYFLTNAAIFYKRDQWRIGLNFKNLFDAEYISSVGGSSRITGIAPGSPFSVVGSISVEF
ncbi:TonB-dependent siderophore receptor [Calothrix sp. PCC 7507]|uniref:TonB-dependent siderophore receptor n=1 Tax=Calothrix sp. PCC 7507 TaxID=99598 RepID=UPI00029F35D2|nr:TonB-dependent siderophore receptor [Calothrix sp. PCC 7507]AFY33148.1 TonB-dependent siderophore receptor [Calothrix sp. PCC 7507]